MRGIAAISAAGSLAAAMSLSGCAIVQIRDDVRRINVQFEETRTSLDQLHDDVETIAADLETLESMSDRLDALHTDLEVLASIERSLARLDTHLESLRGTIENIDRTIPLLQIAEPAPPEPRQ